MLVQRGRLVRLRSLRGGYSPCPNCGSRKFVQWTPVRFYCAECEHETVASPDVAEGIEDDKQDKQDPAS